MGRQTLGARVAAKMGKVLVLQRPVFLSHPAFLGSGFGHNHPLAIPRQATVIALAKALNWLDDAAIQLCPLPDRSTLTRLHTSDYLEVLETAAVAMTISPGDRQRYNLGTMECPLFDGLWDRARATVGGSIEAAKLVRDGGVAFHPAGGTHHGQPNRASGFCYFNDPAFALLTFLDRGLERVVSIDLDAHHGDGVENMFAADRRVTTISIHEAGRWPGTGATGDRRHGRACNMAVPPHINDTEWRYLIAEVVIPIIERLRPDAAVVTCGVDALAGDPLSTMAISNVALWDAVIAITERVPRAVVCGGGGYNPWTLARAWAGLWGRLNGFAIPAVLPADSQAILGDLGCDLIDREERDPQWLTTLADVPNEGAMRLNIMGMARESASR